MVALAPERVYVTEDVYDDPRAVWRAERLIGGMAPGSVETVSEERLRELVIERGWRNIPRWGRMRVKRDPDFVLTMAKFHDAATRQERANRMPELRTRDLLGYFHWWFRPDGELWWRKERKGIVCQSAYQLHTMDGCPFRCAYCGLGGLNRVFVNIEEFVEQLDGWLAVAPAQRLYKWDNHGEVSALEPEYDASRLMVEYFANRPGKYLEIYVGKSDNVDYLLDLDHRRQTILQWSVGCRSQCELFEEKAAPMEARIEAARKCQQAGYIVRFRLSPIIPVRNWREENRELIELIFARTKPDVISLCVFGWMDVEDARSCLDFSLLDPDFVAAMEAAAPFLRERGYTSGGGRPIPHDARAVLLRFLIDEIRRVSSKTVIALCLETEEMWRLFERDLGQRPEAYICNCGPYSTPGFPLYDRMVGGA